MDSEMYELRVFRRKIASILRDFCFLFGAIMLPVWVVMTLAFSVIYKDISTFIPAVVTLVILFAEVVVSFLLQLILTSELVVYLDENGIFKETRWSKKEVLWTEIAQFRTFRSLSSRIGAINLFGIDGKRKMTIPAFVDCAAIAGLLDELGIPRKQ